ncbi:hypothetical protein BAE44_0017364 [Dichanthelium oligosanthes]|uniref:Pentatricopeptide repeat-containing protein n=1 Tax=Dichanthelium oligosanthes TaxID=888268 RepID=A0A1E5V8Z8_9POAL|nr:hypothetical protein BAE44_0017364 [Dichanthelium oligosanthes]
MVRVGEKENDFCSTSVLSAFSALASLEHRKMVHCRAVKARFCFDMILGNALLDMYFKCGSSADAHFVFDTMRAHDVVDSYGCWVWAACRGGIVDEGLSIFRSMEHHGIKPEREHCACLVYLLGHAGRLNEAETLIRKMGLQIDTFAWESLLGACGINTWRS